MNSTNLHHFYQIIFPGSWVKEKNPTSENDVGLNWRYAYYSSNFIVLIFISPKFLGITGTSILKPGATIVLATSTLYFQPSTIYAVGGKLLKKLLASQVVSSLER